MRDRPPLLNGVRIPYGLPVAQLRDLLASPGPDAWAAFIALGFDGTPPSESLLIDLTSHSDWTFRRSAVEALGTRERSTAAYQRILAALSDASPHVVSAACEAIESLRLMGVHAQLLPLVDHPSDLVACVALRTLRRVWHPDVHIRVFKAMTCDNRATVADEAAWALYANPDRATWRCLFDVWCADTIPRRRVWACQLAELHGATQVSAVLLQLSKDKDGHVRKAAARALAAR